MGVWRNLLGTVETTFSIGKGRAEFDASAVTTSRVVTIPDKAGTLAMLDDVTAVSASAVDGGSPTTDTTAPYFRTDFGGVT